ncbi:hypothetical protein HK104_003137 [Borealophlyctis nickersoniae]|nr:hypothetical protein HK104_003137 [Borealophlyctis nickersoniae]
MGLKLNKLLLNTKGSTGGKDPFGFTSTSASGRVPAREGPRQSFDAAAGLFGPQGTGGNTRTSTTAPGDASFFDAFGLGASVPTSPPGARAKVLDAFGLAPSVAKAPPQPHHTSAKPAGSKLFDAFGLPPPASKAQSPPVAPASDTSTKAKESRAHSVMAEPATAGEPSFAPKQDRLHPKAPSPSPAAVPSQPAAPAVKQPEQPSKPVSHLLSDVPVQSKSMRQDQVVPSENERLGREPPRDTVPVEHQQDGATSGPPNHAWKSATEPNLGESFGNAGPSWSGNSQDATVSGRSTAPLAPPKQTVDNKSPSLKATDAQRSSATPAESFQSATFNTNVGSSELWAGTTDFNESNDAAIVPSMVEHAEAPFSSPLSVPSGDTFGANPFALSTDNNGTMNDVFFSSQAAAADEFTNIAHSQSKPQTSSEPPLIEREDASQHDTGLVQPAQHTEFEDIDTSSRKFSFFSLGQPANEKPQGVDGGAASRQVGKEAGLDDLDDLVFGATLSSQQSAEEFVQTNSVDASRWGNHSTSVANDFGGSHDDGSGHHGGSYDAFSSGNERGVAIGSAVYKPDVDVHEHEIAAESASHSWNSHGNVQTTDGNDQTAPVSTSFQPIQHTNEHQDVVDSNPYEPNTFGTADQTSFSSHGEKSFNFGEQTSAGAEVSHGANYNDNTEQSAHMTYTSNAYGYGGEDAVHGQEQDSTPYGPTGASGFSSYGDSSSAGYPLNDANAQAEPLAFFDNPQSQDFPSFDGSHVGQTFNNSYADETTSGLQSFGSDNVMMASFDPSSANAYGQGDSSNFHNASGGEKSDKDHQQWQDPFAHGPVDFLAGLRDTEGVGARNGSPEYSGAVGDMPKAPTVNEFSTSTADQAPSSGDSSFKRAQSYDFGTGTGKPPPVSAAARVAQTMVGSMSYDFGSSGAAAALDKPPSPTRAATTSGYPVGRPPVAPATGANPYASGAAGKRSSRFGTVAESTKVNGAVNGVGGMGQDYYAPPASSPLPAPSHGGVSAGEYGGAGANQLFAASSGEYESRAGRDYSAEESRGTSLSDSASNLQDVVFCPKCSKRNDTEANFCNKCGSPLANVPTVGAEMAYETNKIASMYQQGQEQARPPSAPIDSRTSPAQLKSPIEPHRPPSVPLGTALDASPNMYRGTGPRRAKTPNAYAQGTQPAVRQALDVYGRPSSPAPGRMGPTGQPAQQQPPQFQDPLNRHRGNCIAVFGFGGKLLITRPRHQNRYITDPATGVPSVVEKSYPGSVSLVPVHKFVDPAVTEEITHFSGPLLGGKQKFKKKDVVGIVDNFVKEAEGRKDVAKAEVERKAKDGHGMPEEEIRNLAELEDEVLVWKLLKLTIEQDGVLLTASTGKPNAGIASLCQLFDTMATPSETSAMSGIAAALVKGDRDGACRMAVDSELWGHALVIASQISRECYHDVVTQFARYEFEARPEGDTVFKNGPKIDRPTLKVLYGLFAGAGPAVGPSDAPVLPNTEYVSKWREIVAAVLNNRTPGDASVLYALGDRLQENGRKNAAQFCYVLAPNPATFSGVDTPQVRTVLIGVNHMAHPNTFYRSPRAIQATEIFEYGQTLVSGIGLSNCLPHFQAYKLVYAWYLADLGYTDIATKYCVSIEQFVQTYVKGSPYFHRVFGESLKELAERLVISTNKAGSPSSSIFSGGKEGGGWLSKLSKFGAQGFDKIMNNALGEQPEPGGLATGVPPESKGVTPGFTTLATVPPEPIRPSSTPALGSMAADGSQMNESDVFVPGAESGIQTTPGYFDGVYSGYAGEYGYQPQQQAGIPDAPATEGGDFGAGQVYGATTETGGADAYEYQGYAGYDQQQYDQGYQAYDGHQGQSYAQQQGQSPEYGQEAHEDQQHQSMQGYDQQQQQMYQQSTPGYDQQQQPSYDQQFQGYEQQAYDQQASHDIQHSQTYDQSSYQQGDQEGYDQQHYYGQQQGYEQQAQQQYAHQQGFSQQDGANAQDAPYRDQGYDQHQQSFGQGYDPAYGKGAQGSYDGYAQDQYSFAGGEAADGASQTQQEQQQSGWSSVNYGGAYDNQNPTAQFSTPQPGQNAGGTAQEEDLDDLGFGNSALKGKEKASAADVGSGAEASSKVDNDQPTEGDENKNQIDKSSGTYTSIVSVFNIFGRGKKDKTKAAEKPKDPGSGPVKANLGESSSFYYDPDKKKWVNKNSDGKEEEKKELPPPPMGRTLSAPGAPPPTPAGGNTPLPSRPASAAGPAFADSRLPSPGSTSAPSSPAPEGGPFGATPKRAGGAASRRGARNRYVDVMNPDSHKNAGSSTSVKSFIPTIPTPDIAGGAQPRIMTPVLPHVPQAHANSGSFYDHFAGGDQAQGGQSAAEPAYAEQPQGQQGPGTLSRQPTPSMGRQPTPNPLQAPGTLPRQPTPGYSQGPSHSGPGPSRPASGQQGSSQQSTPQQQRRPPPAPTTASFNNRPPSIQAQRTPLSPPQQHTGFGQPQPAGYPQQPPQQRQRQSMIAPSQQPHAGGGFQGGYGAGPGYPPGAGFSGGYGQQPSDGYGQPQYGAVGVGYADAGDAGSRRGSSSSNADRRLAMSPKPAHAQQKQGAPPADF